VSKVSLLLTWPINGRDYGMRNPFTKKNTCSSAIMRQTNINECSPDNSDVKPMKLMNGNSAASLVRPNVDLQGVNLQGRKDLAGSPCRSGRALQYRQHSFFRRGAYTLGFIAVMDSLSLEPITSMG